MNSTKPTFDEIRPQFSTAEKSHDNLPTISTKLLAAFVRQEVAELGRLRDEQDAVTEELAKLDAELESEEQSLQELESELRAIESASPVTLHRLKLDPAAAAKKADELRNRNAALSKTHEEKVQKREQLSAQSSSQGTDLRKHVETAANHRMLLAQADFCALICSTIPGGSHDVLHTLIHNHPELWHSSSAYRLAEDQLRRIRKTEDLLGVLDEMLSEPVIEVQRFPVALHDSKSTPLAREVSAFSK